MMSTSAIDSFAAVTGLVEGPDAPSTRVEVTCALAAFDLRAGASVLDAPCGNGRHAVALARLGMQVTAVDIDAASLRIARGWEGSGAVAFHEADLLTSGGPTGAYDAVLSYCSCLGYLAAEADDVRLLRRLAGFVRPGGGFLLSTANRIAVARLPAESARFTTPDAVVVRTDTYDAGTGTLLRDYEITPTGDGAPRRIVHARHLYDPVDVRRLLEACGLRIAAVCADFSGQPFDRDASLHSVYLCERQR